MILYRRIADSETKRPLNTEFSANKLGKIGMIWESAYWKDDLLRSARILKKKRYQKVWRESCMALVEKTVLTGFYVIRKLIEAHKLSDVIAQQKFSIKSHRHCGNPVTLLNWDHIEKHYDLNSRDKTQRTLTWLSNQMIHSYIFIISFDIEGRMDGIFFVSDKERNKGLHYLSADRIIEIFEMVGKNYPWKAHYRFNSKTKDYKINQQ